MQLASSFQIGTKKIGGNAPCFVIAEAGVAHFGDIQKAYQLIDLAKEAHADAVKFQIFDIEEMIAPSSKEWRDRLSTRMLPPDAFKELQSYCKKQDIIFFATAHDQKSFDFLEQELNPPLHKIGSGELKNWGYLAHIAQTQKPVIFSTGMYQIDDVSKALQTMTATGNDHIAILQCTTSYPTSPKEVHLKVMDEYKKQFGGIIGYSDHTEGYHIPLAAVARGAQIIEKHITLDYNIPNAQDWKVSCGPDNLKAFIAQLRDIEKALGTSEKKPSNKETENSHWARKSLVAACTINAGEAITSDMLITKRPGNGIAPDEIKKVTGKKALSAIAKDTALSWEQLS